MNKWCYLFSLIFLMSFFSCGENKKSSSVELIEGSLVENPTSTPTYIEVFGEQFQWTVRYAGKDNELGKFDYKLINEENPLGLITTETIQARLTELENEVHTMDSMSLHMEVTDEFMNKRARNEKFIRLLRQMRDKHIASFDELAQDDLIVSDTLVLCVDTEYEFRFRSKDVIHAAYFPHFRAQMNTVPGMAVRFKYTPTETTSERRKKENDENFEFILKCNKVCGAGHDSMQMVVRVVEEKDYNKWLSSHESHLFGSPKSIVKQ